MKKINFTIRKSILMTLLVALVSLVTTNIYAYKTEEDCEIFEGPGGCCKSSDGSYHKDGGCECIIAALNGNMNAYDLWIKLVEKEYQNYSGTEILCKSVAKNDRSIANLYLKESVKGSGYAKFKLAEMTKKAEESEAKEKIALENLAWAKTEITKVKKYKSDFTNSVRKNK